jgi:hypothetical protein
MSAALNWWWWDITTSSLARLITSRHIQMKTDKSKRKLKVRKR